jgi:hypothetical protein
MGSKHKSEDDDLAGTITSGRVPTNSVEMLRLAQKLLQYLPPTLQVLLALIGLCVAIYFGRELSNRLNNNQENVARALGASLVSTAYPHRGVTAFLLAELDQTLPPDKTYSRELTTTLADIDTSLKTFTEHLGNFNPEQVVKSLNLTVSDIDADSKSESDSASDPAWKKSVMSTDTKNGFVMVPAISLRRGKLGENPLNAKNLTDVLSYNPEILSDLQVASVLDKPFRKFDSVTVQSLSVVQTYFISESGVIYLQASPTTGTNTSYPRKFPRYTLFMDRPYFWGAVDPNSAPKGKAEDSPFDYQTEPYIDLGGHGIVKTYSKKVDLPNHRVGVICVDVTLPSDSVKDIEQRLKVLGANVKDFVWITGPGEYSGKEGDTPEGFEWVERQLKLQGQEQSRILGAVAFESDYHKQNKGDVIRFTLPIGSEESGDGRTKTKLLLVSFDFAGISKAIFIDSLGFLLGISLLVLVSWNVFYDYSVLKREMNKVLENMSEVMHEAATPFVWLDEKNEFHKVNLSFLRVVGCNNDMDLKQHAPTFRDLVTGETQPIYDGILAQSARGEKTGKYEIDIINKHDEVLHVSVHGERIPYPTFWRRGLPHRFGVFLPWPPKTAEHSAATTSQSDSSDVPIKHA